MAHVYVRSGAGGAGTGADWANAYTTLAAALTAKAAGDQFWVSEDHAETQASAMTLTSPGTAAAPCTVTCVNHSGTVPPVSADVRTTATVTTTGANVITWNGFATYDGITFASGSGSNAVTTLMGNSATHGLRFKNCAISLPATTNGALQVCASAGNIGGFVDWDNTTYSVGATGTTINGRSGRFNWHDTPSAIVGTPPTTLFNIASAANFAGQVYIENVDLSALAGTFCQNGALSSRQVVLKNCKTHASLTLAGAPAAPGAAIFNIRSDSAGNNYRQEKVEFPGSQVVETTIVRTGGASDGATSIAWKFVTTANAKWLTPFESMPMAVWLDNLVSTTITVYGIAASLPTQDDIWLEVSYLGSAASPIATRATSGKADLLATGGNLTADSSTWGGSTTAFKMSVTFTPAMKGPVTAVIKVGGASKTIYIDPKLAVS